MTREDADAASHAAARRARARDLFATELERADLTPATFAALIAANPDLEPELLELSEGLALFRAQRPGLIELERSRRRARRRWTLVAAAACLVVAGTIWSLSSDRWSSERNRSPDPTAVSRSNTTAEHEPIVEKPELAGPGAPTPESPRSPTISLAERGVALLEDVVSRGDSGDPALLRARSDAFQSASMDREAAGTAGFFSTVERLAKEQPAPVSDALLGRLADVRSALQAPGASALRKKAAAAIESDQALEPGRPFLLALRSDPAVRSIVANAPVQLSEEAAQLLAKLRKQAVFRLRAIDLDAKGVECVGARVYARSTDPSDGELGQPRFLGVTPLTHELDAGDWRIIVVDEGDPTAPRHSELRFLAMPGEDLGLRVAFLRDGSAEKEQMAEFEPCSFLFGAPPGEGNGSSTLPQAQCSAPRLWVDPLETTCEEYSEFFLELDSHHEWFDGTMPVHRPNLLDADGRCPPSLSRRPIIGITWDEATLYANWRGKRLPTEREWERVARGSSAEDRRYPWGDHFRADLINEHDSMAALVKALALPGGRANIPSFAELRGGEVDAADYLEGSATSDDGVRVYRLADNVSEFTEDLYVEAKPNGAWTFLSVNAVIRVAKGGNWFIGGEDQARTWSRVGATAGGGMLFGVRAVMTDLSDALPK